MLYMLLPTRMDEARNSPTQSRRLPIRSRISHIHTLMGDTLHFVSAAKYNMLRIEEAIAFINKIWTIMLLLDTMQFAIFASSRRHTLVECVVSDKFRPFYIRSLGCVRARTPIYVNPCTNIMMFLPQYIIIVRTKAYVCAGKGC